MLITYFIFNFNLVFDVFRIKDLEVEFKAKVVFDKIGKDPIRKNKALLFYENIIKLKVLNEWKGDYTEAYIDTEYDGVPFMSAYMDHNNKYSIDVDLLWKFRLDTFYLNLISGMV